MASANSVPAAVRRRRALAWIGVHAFAVAAALFFILPFVFVCADRGDE